MPSRREKAVPEPLLSATLALPAGADSHTTANSCERSDIRHVHREVEIAGVVVAIATLGVASAATALMAFQEPAKKYGPPAALGTTQEFETKAISKALGKAVGNPLEALVVDDSEEERDAEEVGRMRAELEMLEFKSEGLRSRIERGLLMVDQLEDSLHEEIPNLTPEQIEKNRKKVSDRLDENATEYRGVVETVRENTRRDCPVEPSDRASAPNQWRRRSVTTRGKSLSDLVRRIDRLEARSIASPIRFAAAEASSSNLKRLEVGDALLRELPVLLDEVVLDAAGLRCGEGLHPVDGALADSNLRARRSASAACATLW